MPVEIRELIIKASTTIDQEDDNRIKGQQELVEDKEMIVEECVKQVLKILERRRER